MTVALIISDFDLQVVDSKIRGEIFEAILYAWQHFCQSGECALFEYTYGQLQQLSQPQERGGMWWVTFRVSVFHKRFSGSIKIEVLENWLKNPPKNLEDVECFVQHQPILREV